MLIVVTVYGLLQENGPELKWDDAKHICSKYINKRSVNFELILVYGHAGNELLIMNNYSYILVTIVTDNSMGTCL